MIQTNIIEKSDILSRDEYKIKRKNLREKMVLRKKLRRVDVGPYVTMYFENKDTIIHQINEMVYIEDGGEEQINDEILAYKSLVPAGRELVATVMVEIDNPIKRTEFLSKMGGFEEQISIKIHDKIFSVGGQFFMPISFINSSRHFVHSLGILMTMIKSPKYRCL